MTDDRQRRLALERQQRYLARKRGEDVPLRRGGRPRKEKSPAPKEWEEWVHKGNRAIFLGIEGGYTHWELGDLERKAVVLVRLEEGAETWNALQRFYMGEMTMAALKTKEGELGEISRAAAESIDDSGDDDFALPLTAHNWPKTLLKVGLRTAADFFEHGRFMPQEGDLYRRVDGSKRDEEEEKEGEGTP